MGGRVTEVVGVGPGVDVLTEVGLGEGGLVTGVVLTVLPMVLLEGVVPEVVVGLDPVGVGGALLLDTLGLDTVVLVVLWEVGPGITQGFIIAGKQIVFPLQLPVSLPSSANSTTRNPGSKESRKAERLTGSNLVIQKLHTKVSYNLHGRHMQKLHL